VERKLIMTDQWKTTRCIQSSDENVFKYVFEKDNAVAESVLYKYPTFEERTVVCCSTQSGCPIGCRFCGAGDSFVRSLTADEIVSQTQHLFADKGIDAEKVQRMQIMFMSMGEPLLNLKELNPAIRKLNALYPKAALLVSTSAPKVDYQPMIDISKEVDKVGLQFSVHESTDEARNNLIPFKNKLTLQEIAQKGVRWAMAVGRQPFFNYCAHDKNSSEADADRILNLFDPSIWQATISVICEREETVAAANARQRDLASDFQQKLLQRGYSTRMFDPAGQDTIGGGCGQLWFVQSWMKNNPQLARPSVGRRLPVVHTPR
jgi:23S rRNA (adenine2503-C2)-methyltransferase